MRRTPCRWRVLATLLSVSVTVPTVHAETVTLSERFTPGLEHHVSTRVRLSGELLVPMDKDKAPQKVAMSGESVIEYDERILPAEGKAGDQKALRVYRQIDFRRTIGDRSQEMNLRPEVRKIVVFRSGPVKNSFSPDGPLTWGEIDLLRTDIFTPGLAGLLPANAVKPGETWKADEAALRELTDMDQIAEGGVDCRLEEVTMIGGRQVAHVRFSGTLRGVNEDGPNRQVLTGTFYFDLATNHLSYLSLKGEHHLLDKDGQTAGKVTGQYILTRSLNPRHRELTDEAVARTAVTPSPESTSLLYDNPDLGVRFLYPRRWKVGRVNGPQIALDDPEGNGVLITVEPLKRVPTAAAYLKETQDYLTGQKAKFLDYERPRRLSDAPTELDRFALAIELSGRRVLMDYFVARQPRGGAAIAARLLERDRDALRKEVERIARSLTITRDLNGR